MSNGPATTESSSTDPSSKSAPQSAPLSVETQSVEKQADSRSILNRVPEGGTRDADQISRSFPRLDHRPGLRALPGPGRGAPRDHGRPPRDSQHAHRLRQVAGGAGHALQGPVRREDAASTPVPSRRWRQREVLRPMRRSRARERGHADGRRRRSTPERRSICCTAEVLSNRALRQGADVGADYVVMDEFHYYGDPERGAPGRCR